MASSARERLRNASRRLTAGQGNSAPAAKKSLGQHFLTNPGICRRIVDLIAPSGSDNILEIGPGPGALTGVLEKAPHARLLLLEKDDYWAGVRAKEGGPSTEVRCMDALTFPWGDLEGQWKLIGNLPYNVASPLIWDIAWKCRALTRAAFMVQKEVGDRLAAAPGTRHYGALSVWVQAWLCVRMEFTLGPGAFSPPPKVDSAVLSFTPIPPERHPKNPERLASLIKLCFQQRRKQMGGLFRRAGRGDLLDGLAALGISPEKRPEELSVSDFLALSEQSVKSVTPLL